MLTKLPSVKIALFFLTLLLNACAGKDEGADDTQPKDLQISSTSASFTISRASLNLTQSKNYEITWKRPDIETVIVGVLNSEFPTWLRIYNSIITSSPVTTTLEVDATGLDIGTYSVTMSIVSNRPKYEQVDHIEFPLTLTVVP